MNRIIIIIISLISANLSLRAQTTLTVKVLESGNDEPMAGAAVVYSTHADMSSPSYSVTAENGDTRFVLPRKGICHYRINFLWHSVPYTAPTGLP